MGVSFVKGNSPGRKSLSETPKEITPLLFTCRMKQREGYGEKEGDVGTLSKYYVCDCKKKKRSAGKMNMTDNIVPYVTICIKKSNK